MSNDLLKLDVRVLDHVYLNADFGIYNVELLNSNEVREKGSDEELYIDTVEEVTITGNFDKRMFFGEEYYMYGTPTNHPRYGFQYKVQLVQEKFDTPERVSSFLRQFCAESIVKQLVDKYGGEVIQRILQNEVDYSDIKGMKEVRFQQLQDKVKENEYMRDIIANFTDYGITPNQMRNIIKKFGANAVSKVKENPYCLCQVHGIGFMKADEIAKRAGYDMESPNRIAEAIKYVIGQMQNNGDVWVDRNVLLNQTGDLVDLKKSLINEILELGIHEVVIVDKNKVTLQSSYDAEDYIAKRLLKMLESSTKLEFDVEKFIEEKNKKLAEEDKSLTEQQADFLRMFCEKNVVLLVGYAGTGKSFIQSMTLEIVDKLHLSCLLLAPTGKAAKVMQGYTKREAYTIHRALGIGDRKNERLKEIWEDVVIVDESSMCDVYIMSSLLKAIKNHNTKIIFCGDNFQLPSVGIGNFLHDIIESNAFPMTKLTKVWRQAEGGVLDIVTKIRTKERFVDNKFVGKQQFGKDMMFHSCPPSYMEKGFMHYYEQALENFNVDDIVVLSPTKKGGLGTVAINAAIQELVNPPSKMKKEVKFGQKVTYRENDRVINIKNNYGAINTNGDKVTIVNGDIGVILKIDDSKQQMIIDYDSEHVITPFSALETITHSYSLTIHKSQGSGFPCVIVVSDKSHKWQLNANLLYTAYTRTQRFLCALCQSDIINAAMNKNMSFQRNTFLREIISERDDLIGTFNEGEEK